MILIILCTVQAVKARKIPENFNEAKYDEGDDDDDGDDDDGDDDYTQNFQVHWVHNVLHLHRMACFYSNILRNQPRLSGKTLYNRYKYKYKL